MYDASPLEVELTAHPENPRLGVLRLNRGPVNALSQKMWDQLTEVGEALHRHAAFRAIIVGEGERHFAAGADVKELVGLSVETFCKRNKLLQRAFHLIATAPQIVIAAINGYALGGGCELALAADFRVAGQGSLLGLPETTLGIIPGSGGTQRLARLVGPSRAKDLILSGRMVPAAEALEIGLVDEVVEDAAVFDTAVRRALPYADGPYALRLAKRAIDEGLGRPMDAGLELEAGLVTEGFASEDGQLGLRSFVEKGPRKAQFRGR